LSKQVEKAGPTSALISFFKRQGAWLHELTNFGSSQQTGVQLSKKGNRRNRISSLINFFERLDAGLHQLAVVLVSIMLTVTKVVILYQWLMTPHS
jgi:hypothetical protein